MKCFVPIFLGACSPGMREPCERREQRGALPRVRLLQHRPECSREGGLVAAEVFIRVIGEAQTSTWPDRRCGKSATGSARALPRLDRVERDLLGHPITEEMGVTGNDLGPEAPELWITQAKDRVEGVA